MTRAFPLVPDAEASRHAPSFFAFPTAPPSSAANPCRYQKFLVDADLPPFFASQFGRTGPSFRGFKSRSGIPSPSNGASPDLLSSNKLVASFFPPLLALFPLCAVGDGLVPQTDWEERPVGPFLERIPDRSPLDPLLEASDAGSPGRLYRRAFFFVRSGSGFPFFPSMWPPRMEVAGAKGFFPLRNRSMRLFACKRHDASFPFSWKFPSRRRVRRLSLAIRAKPPQRERRGQRCFCFLDIRRRFFPRGNHASEPFITLLCFFLRMALCLFPDF